MAAIEHPLNWHFGWWMILLSFLTGLIVGVAFHRDDFWGGYTSFRRRIFRLGHIALAELGMLNLLFAISPWPAGGTWPGQIASAGFAAGGAIMPIVCFLAAWRDKWRVLFPLPVASLITAALCVVIGGIA